MKSLFSKKGKNIALVVQESNILFDEFSKFPNFPAGTRISTNGKYISGQILYDDISNNKPVGNAYIYIGKLSDRKHVLFEHEHGPVFHTGYFNKNGDYKIEKSFDCNSPSK